MRSVSSALAAYLDDPVASAHPTVAELYTLVLSGGATYRWTSADVDVLCEGNTYLSPSSSSGAPVIVERDQFRQAARLEVDEMQLTLGCGDGAAKLGSTPLVQAALAEALDGATMEIALAYLVGSAWERDARFKGNVDRVEPSSTEVKLYVRSKLADLDRKLPRFTFQTQCGHALYDPGCAVAKASFGDALTAGSGATATSIPATSGRATGWFNGGHLIFTSGALSGKRVSVKTWTTGGTFALSRPLDAVPAQGDSFTAYAGCDKTKDTCQNKFANLTRFRGFPYIPRGLINEKPPPARPQPNPGSPRTSTP